MSELDIKYKWNTIYIDNIYTLDNMRYMNHTIHQDNRDTYVHHTKYVWKCTGGI
jgi:hypothetical protein